MSYSVLLAGCGNMGFAMLKGWIEAGVARPGDLMVVEPNEAMRDRARAAGIQAVATPEELAGRPADLILIAVKPQVLAQVLPAYRDRAGAGACFLSVVAGAKIATFEHHLGSGTGIIRSMPNTPAAIGAGMIATVTNGKVPAPIDAFAHRLLSANGVVDRLDDEALMDAVTAVSGSGPAYLFHMIEALTEAAQIAGLPADRAATYAMQTIYGAARLAKESGEPAGELRRKVTSPNGTTAAALGVLMGGDGLTRMMTQAVEAARIRAVELGKT